MNNINEQLDHLKEIRNLMERSSRFVSLSGKAGISAGIIALAGALVAYWGLQFDIRYFEPERYFAQTRFTLEHPYVFLVMDGLAVLILAIGSAIWFTTRIARKKGQKIWDPSTKKLLFSMAFPLFSGGIFCIILLFHHLAFLLAPVTLIFYGLALISASQHTYPVIWYLGISEIILGLASSVMLGYGLLFWAAGFGLLHIFYGIYTWQKYERNSPAPSNQDIA